MRSGSARRLAVAFLIGSVLCLLFRLSASERMGAMARVGFPDGAPALILEYMAGEPMGPDLAISRSFDLYPTKDCCTSTSEWALSSGSLDMALMCPDSAERLVRRDGRYEVAGPCMVNSDVVVIRDRSEGAPRKIAVSHGRDVQKRLVDRIFGKQGVPEEMTTSAIPYAYETGVVDGAVIDILKASRLKGEMIPSAAGREDLVTYVLVVKKTFREGPRYTRFLRAYGEALDQLNRDALLAYAMRRYAKPDATGEKVKAWKRMKVRFVLPQDRVR